MKETPLITDRDLNKHLDKDDKAHFECPSIQSVITSRVYLEVLREKLKNNPS